jgi:XTP/dITP diphosphohydrolase
VTPRRVAFYTSNAGKFEEVRAFLRPLGFSLRWVRGELLEPQADTLERVVEVKLGQVRPREGEMALVEDAGLFVPALGGFPGVYSAYVYRTLGTEGLLRLVAGRPRRAEFRAVAGVRVGSRNLLRAGTVRGSLARLPRGDGGFGFDPIFLPLGERRTFAELPREEKVRRSHRTRAIEGILRALGAPAPGKEA